MPFGLDYLQLVAVVAVMTVVIVKTLTNILPFKINLYSLLYGKGEMTQTFNVGICVLLCASTSYLALVFPNISSVLGLFGGVASVNICFLVPLVVYLNLKTNEAKWYEFKNILAFTTFMTLIVFGLISVW
eukprot:CAMPEP_0170563654 /NCGR_PEP_ID=MMETSP0211-20121228/67987_1 /TAXON_ID=311385 /ORGANISM="Pseudokeronopsis sp., Strain OXSARD2" /LENGTH=129 /DNA_ID=CAMNT_0010882145 /DNA_START=691 /DNA_END=1077 /DNA_ORIENTATION=-